jgi:hypothetical protein
VIVEHCARGWPKLLSEWPNYRWMDYKKFCTELYLRVSTLRVCACAHYLCTTDSCARSESLKSLAGNPIFLPKHQLHGHKEKKKTLQWKHHKTPQTIIAQPHKGSHLYYHSRHHQMKLSCAAKHLCGLPNVTIDVKPQRQKLDQSPSTSNEPRAKTHMRALPACHARRGTLWPQPPWRIEPGQHIQTPSAANIENLSFVLPKSPSKQQNWSTCSCSQRKSCCYCCCCSWSISWAATHSPHCIRLKQCDQVKAKCHLQGG